MKQTVTLLLLTAVLCWAPGCSLCQSCLDDTYAAYGGRWQRGDMTRGRVGSVLDPAGGPVEGSAGGELIYTEQVGPELVGEWQEPTPAVW